MKLNLTWSIPVIDSKKLTSLLIGSIVFSLSSDLKADLKDSKGFEQVQKIIQTKQGKENLSQQELAKEILEEYLEYASGSLKAPHRVDPDSINEARANIYIVKTLSRLSKNKKKPFPPTLVSDRLEIIENGQLESEIVKAIEKITKPAKSPAPLPTKICDPPTTQPNKIEKLAEQVDEISSKTDVFLLLQNATGSGEHPRNFRTTLVPQTKIDENEPRTELLEKDIDQIKALNISGSAQPSHDELLFLANHEYKDKAIVVTDLRLETHVLVNGQPFSKHGYFNGLNWGKTQAQVEEEEHAYAQHLNGHDAVQFSVVQKGGKIINGKKSGDVSEWKVDSKQVPKEHVLTEKETIDSVNKVLEKEENSTRYVYKRIANPDLHRPRDEQVDEFVKFITTVRKDVANQTQKKPEDVVLHFHCKAGRGRTTTAMLMADAIQNYESTNANELMRRQHSLGGSNLNAEGKQAKDVRGTWSIERDRFVRNFVQYVKEAGPEQFKVSWSEWLKQHPDAKAQTNH
jgi:protein-tyrosine phosphatase